jgi:hypothetical protein
MAPRVLGADRHGSAQDLWVVRDEFIRPDSRERPYNRCQFGYASESQRGAPYLSLTSLNEIGCRRRIDSLTIHPLERDAKNGPGTCERRRHCCTMRTK